MKNIIHRIRKRAYILLEVLCIFQTRRVVVDACFSMVLILQPLLLQCGRWFLCKYLKAKLKQQQKKILATTEQYSEDFFIEYINAGKRLGVRIFLIATFDWMLFPKIIDGKNFQSQKIIKYLHISLRMIRYLFLDQLGIFSRL